jgi:hypothetical protein
MSTDIITTVSANPVLVLTDEKTYSQFYQSMQDEIAEFKPDISTAKSRAEIAKMAFKITRSKTAIDVAGKRLNEDARARINKVDAARRKIREELDALAEKVRQPLTDWETAEEARQTEAKRIGELISELSRQSADLTAAAYQQRLNNLNAIALDAEFLGEFFSIFDKAKSSAVQAISTALSIAVKNEEDAAELEKLLAEKAEREATELAAQEAERIAAAELEAYKKAVAEQTQQAELATKREAERQAEIVAQAKAEAESIAAFAAAKAAEEAAASAKKLQDDHAAELAKLAAEKQKLEAAEQERLAEAARIQAAETERNADRAHRSKIMGEAKVAIMVFGADEETAKKIVLAIVAGEVPNVRMQF